METGRRWPGIAIAVLLIGVGIAGLWAAMGDQPGTPVVESSDGPGAVVDPGAAPTGGTSPTATSTAAPTPDPTPGPADAWAALDRDGAFDRLIDLAEDRAVAAASDGEAEAVVHHARVDGDRLDLDRETFRWSTDGGFEHVRSVLGNADPGDRSLAAWRDAYAAAAEVDEEREASGAGDPRDVPAGIAERVLDEAPGMDDAEAFAEVHEAFELLWATDELRTAQAGLLTLLRGLDADVVDVAGTTVDLLGRDVVVVAGSGDTADVLLFSAADGALAGIGVGSVDAGWTEIRAIEGPAAAG